MFIIFQFFFFLYLLFYKSFIRAHMYTYIPIINKEALEVEAPAEEMR